MGHARVGTIDPQVPRVRDGSLYPALLEPRRLVERALAAVVQEAYVQGVSTRRVGDLVQARGCVELDEQVERFHGRRLDGPTPTSGWTPHKPFGAEFHANPGRTST